MSAINRDKNKEIMSIDQLLQAREERDFLLNYLSTLNCLRRPCAEDGCLFPDLNYGCLDSVKQWVADSIKKGWRWGE